MANTADGDVRGCNAQGTDLGPLQGIPYGLKDLIAVEGYRTTWGMPSRMNQVLQSSAHVYKRCGARLHLATQALEWEPKHSHTT